MWGVTPGGALAATWARMIERNGRAAGQVNEATDAGAVGPGGEQGRHHRTLAVPRHYDGPSSLLRMRDRLVLSGWLGNG